MLAPTAPYQQLLAAILRVTTSVLASETTAEKLADASGEFLAVLQHVAFYFGLITFIIGVMAFTLNKKHGPFHIWGRRLAIIGAGFVVFGYNPGWLISLLNYAIST